LTDVKLRYVGNAPFFSSLSEQEQERVSERMHLEHRRSGEALFQKDTESTALYLIKAGWVRLVTNGDIAIASQGPGSLVGETDLFLDRPRSHGAIIAADAELWVLDKEDLIELITESPQLGLKLSLPFGARLALLDQYLVEHRLKPLPFLSGLEEESLAAIARQLVPVEKKTGEYIVEEGQSSEALFIVESGQLYLHSSEEGGDFSELGAGETFGEMAVLTGKPHARSVQAATDVVLWALPTAQFDAVAEEYPDIRLALSKAIREPLLSQDQERAVARLGTMPLFEGLSEEVLWAVSQRLLLHHVPAGELVFAKGAPGDALYLIDSGRVEVVSDVPTTRTVLARLGADEFFGEMALLTGKPRSTTARAVTHTNLWVLYRSDFDDLVNRYPAISLALSRVLSKRLADMDRRFTEGHLRGLKLLTGLSSSQLEDIGRRLKPVRFRQRETIIREGESGDEMYFVESGRAQVVRGSGSRALALTELGAGDLFGEMALLTGNPRSATVTALSDVDLWVMSREDFDDLVTAYPNLALALSRLLSERLQSTDERFLKQPVAPVAVPPPPRPRPAAQPARVVLPPPQARPAPKPSRAVRPVPAKARPVPQKPARSLTSELKQAFGSLVAWYGSLSRGAKVRLILVTMLLVWLVCIAAPALVISTLAADNVTNLQGAIAFVQTEPPLPTEVPLPTDTAIPPVAMSVAPSGASEAQVVVPAEAPAVEQSAPAGAPVASQDVPAQAPVAGQGAPAQAPVAGQDASAEVLASPVDSSSSSAPNPDSPAATATPWIVVVTNTPPPATDTPVPPTATAVPPAQAAGRSVTSAAKPLPTPTAVERPQPARDLDPRLSGLGVVIEPAGVKPGQKYWRLIKARWANEKEAGADHTIYIEVLDESGNRLVGETVEIRWQDGSLPIPTEGKSAPEWPANFPMYNLLGSYAVSVSGLPSDVVAGLGMGTAEQPNFKIHTNFFLTFQRVMR
jgi:CRP-like cAMP-binding protein